MPTTALAGPLHYARTGAGYCLDSLGPAGKDDGGAPVSDPAVHSGPEHYSVVPGMTGDIAATSALTGCGGGSGSTTTGGIGNLTTTFANASGYNGSTDAITGPTLYNLGQGASYNGRSPRTA